jgi:hypothetical protein
LASSIYQKGPLQLAAGRPFLAKRRRPETPSGFKWAACAADLPVLAIYQKGPLGFLRAAFFGERLGPPSGFGPLAAASSIYQKGPYSLLLGGPFWRNGEGLGRRRASSVLAAVHLGGGRNGEG